ncbi:PQQ-dependent sugar dehydrogenase [Candidatus Haliotispira prima]|uniref:PQQ-dependent sugar dehydrogenase n=1 Tax=Candidatus Haliotispira prima TaxID=3034016 RepID=A0ABY8MGQ3_9SPIO|nr:PQQ-dependent sugar dehydrogenase [Candidatus Haliotispira prima]
MNQEPTIMPLPMNAAPNQIFSATCFQWKVIIFSLAVLYKGLCALPYLETQTIPYPVQDDDQLRNQSKIPSMKGVLILEPVLRGLNQPQSIAWVPMKSINKDYVDPYNRFSGEGGHAALVIERKGGLWVLFRGTLYPVQNLPSDVEQLGEGGYLDILYNPWLGRLFLSYTKQMSLNLNTVSVLSFLLRYTEEQFIATGVLEIFRANPPLDQPTGYGGRLSATQEFLYIGLGNRGRPPQAQNPESHWGSINKISLRKGSEAPRERFGLRELFPGSVSYLAPALRHNSSSGSVMISIGHGDIQDLFWDPYRHRVWIVEQLRIRNGIVLNEEINLLEEGLNYGWGRAVSVTEQAGRSESEYGQPEDFSDSRARNPNTAQAGSQVLNQISNEAPNQTNGRNRGPVLDRDQPHGWSSSLVLPARNSRTNNVFQAWADDMLITSFESRSLYRLAFRQDATREHGFRLEFREQLFKNHSGPLRWVGLGPDGAIYLLTNSSQANVSRTNGGKMLRLRPQSPMYPEEAPAPGRKKIPTIRDLRK